MKKTFWIILIIVVAAGLAVWFWQSSKTSRTTTYQNQPSSTKQTMATTPMQITSPAFSPDQSIPKKYTCDGDGVNPPLNFSGLPTAAVSLALILDDPDAPSGTWTHWLVWNIDPGATSIAENSVPQGAVLGKTSSGQNVYGSFCPPVSPDSFGGGGSSAIHHYHFKLYALDAKLTLPSYSQAADLVSAMNGHILQQSEMVAIYSRN